jgi:hypothetical protein
MGHGDKGIMLKECVTIDLTSHCGDKPFFVKGVKNAKNEKRKN